MDRALPRPLAIPLAMMGHGLVWAALLLVAVAFSTWSNMPDGRIFYDVAWPPDYSGSSILTPTNNYSPAFVWWVQPLQAVGWDGFRILIGIAEVAALGYLVTPLLTLLLVVVQAPVVWEELLAGNLNLVMGALLLWAFRHPWLYAVPLLTKVTPGIGLVWFAVRGEWRALALALGVTLAFALPSLILAPGAWVEWAGNLVANDDRLPTLIPQWARMLLGVGIAVWAARTDRPWALLFAIAVGSVGGYRWLMALGIVRMLADRVRADRVVVGRGRRSSPAPVG